MNPQYRETILFRSIRWSVVWRWYRATAPIAFLCNKRELFAFFTDGVTTRVDMRQGLDESMAQNIPDFVPCHKAFIGTLFGQDEGAKIDLVKYG